MTETALDTAFVAMESNAGDDAQRLRFFEALAASELYLLLQSEPRGDNIEPRIFETSEGRFVLIFDREDRLTAFADGPAPYAALPGRTIADMLQDQDIGLGLNLGVAPSSYLIPAGAVAWLAETLGSRPEERDDTPETFTSPGNLPERLLSALDARLARAAGLADLAYLARATYDSGRRSHLLAIVDAVPGAEETLARAVQEALTFSGLDAGEIDVTFLKASDAAAGQLARVGLRFDLPKAEIPTAPSAPGMDPNSPPRLK
ncbi:MAG: SseB family protein [Pseudomonadota bacterium]